MTNTATNKLPERATKLLAPTVDALRDLGAVANIQTLHAAILARGYVADDTTRSSLVMLLMAQIRDGIILRGTDGSMKLA